MSGMHTAFDLSFAHTEGRWALPGSWVGAPFPDVRIYQEIARTAERAGVGMLFFGDGSGIPDTWRGSMDAALEWGIQWPRQDMGPMVASMAAVTSRIGFGLTYSSTYHHPFTVARLLNSLDHVTGGRIAFNVVASARGADAANYGFAERMDHDERYDRLGEFMRVCRALWASVPAEAIIADRATGRFADPALIHPIDHVGTHFRVKGPLSSMPSPQGSPLLVQAGNSPKGIETSAEFVELVFGFGGLEGKRRHRAALDAALERAGRDASTVGILWATQAIVARTSREAAELRDEVAAFWDPEAVGAFLSHNVGFDFATLPFRFTAGELVEAVRAGQGAQGGFVGALVAELGSDAVLTRDELFEHGWRHATGLDHTLCGSAEQVADLLEEDFAAIGGRGGYMFSSPLAAPRGFADLSELLVPELRRRGALAPAYPGRTLRENLAV
ncbi:LLM class flavin-dependent oxidoreductase [Humibacter sp. BT305]|uniref:Methylene-tetrahydromethanopterin reductase n=1 Tax=Cnuibacter physcomitrellae TaxID=1619308 RepID=A0A1X9LFX3_9MICO|nr:NtaA/DmoA family FMN-dependent monooxygenase [Cnuibacter physcomitrellae]ARJ04074.1 methylene-tetrahydromethanopterin reductase [Cnuibacter physcomitrellae]AXH34202.1 LLM class flavin-dependent oxidoreductase [Humibacter sp. BT305]